MTDNGTEFLNKEMKEMCRLYNIEHINSSPGHHQTVGLVERTNQTLFRKLKKLCNFGEKSWEKEVEKAAFGTNISFNRAINTSPYMLKYGKISMLPIDIVYGCKEKTYPREKLFQKRNELFDEYAERNIQKGKISYKPEINVGDGVLVYKEFLGDKFGSGWTEGFKVIEKLNENSYIVEKYGKRFRMNKIHLQKEEKILRGNGGVVPN